MKKLVLALIVLSSISLLAVLFLAREEGLFSPQKIPPSPLVSDKQLTTKRIVGFLPYWQTGSIHMLKFSLLDEIIYFGVHIDEKGNIVKDQGYSRLASLPFTQMGRVSMAVILQDNEKIEIFLKDASAQEQVIKNVSALITQYPKLSGINLDFEYSGIPAKDTVTAYADFVNTVVHELKTHYPSLIISVDVTADAMKKSRLYNVAKLGEVVDYLVLMGYDFYRPSSSVAGPLAPLTGKALYEYDVTTAVADFLTVVPKEKLLLGVAYYGWDFPTVDDSRGSSVEKRKDETVALSSYKRSRGLIAQGTVDLRFDEESQTPWMVYRDPDTNGIRQVWFENEASLGKKYDLVNNEDLAGIAIWALGYDGTHDELWNLLKEKFRR